MTALSQAELVRLSPEERLSLIADLWDSLAKVEIPLTPAQDAELKRRLANPDPAPMSWEQFRAELRQRHP
jgi:putative addiction module component (TIGR02574 family)